MHEDIHDEVVERLKKAYGQVRIGDPLEGKAKHQKQECCRVKLVRLVSPHSLSLSMCAILHLALNL